MKTHKFYRFQLHEVLKMLRKDPVTKKRYKKMSFKEQAHAMLQLTFPHSVHTIDGPILVDEYRWEHVGGKKVIFFEDEATIHRLYHSDIEVQLTDYSMLPFQSFILAVPPGVVLDGVELPSMLVSSNDIRNTQELYDGFIAHYGLEMPEFNLEAENEDEPLGLSIIMREDTEGAYLRTSMTPERLSEICKAKNIDEYVRIANLSTVTSLAGDLPVTKEEHRTNFVMFKLLVSMMVYNAATEGKYFKQGMPDVKIETSAEIAKMPKDTYIFGSHTSTDKAAPTAHVRSWHFRQLRDERYYRSSEHKDKPKGSRIVFVRESLVGAGDTDPYTQSSEKK